MKWVRNEADKHQVKTVAGVSSYPLCFFVTAGYSIASMQMDFQKGHQIMPKAVTAELEPNSVRKWQKRLS